MAVRVLLSGIAGGLCGCYYNYQKTYGHPTIEQITDGTAKTNLKKRIDVVGKWWYDVLDISKKATMTEEMMDKLSERSFRVYSCCINNLETDKATEMEILGHFNGVLMGKTRMLSCAHGARHWINAFQGTGDEKLRKQIEKVVDEKGDDMVLAHMAANGGNPHVCHVIDLLDDHDIGILRIPEEGFVAEAEMLELGNTENLRFHDNLYMVTVLLDDDDKHRTLVTEGKFLQRVINDDDDTHELILYDIPSVEGYSGSPIYNSDGELVAIHVGHLEDPECSIGASIRFIYEQVEAFVERNKEM